jgi:hypothetical protein
VSEKKLVTQVADNRFSTLRPTPATSPVSPFLLKYGVFGTVHISSGTSNFSPKIRVHPAVSHSYGCPLSPPSRVGHSATDTWLRPSIYACEYGGDGWVALLEPCLPMGKDEMGPTCFSSNMGNWKGSIAEVGLRGSPGHPFLNKLLILENGMFQQFSNTSFFLK